MRGTIYKRVHIKKDGSTSILHYPVLSLPGNAGRKRDWGRGYRTRREARAALNFRMSQNGTSSLLAPSTLELGPYLTAHWLPSMRDRIEATTYAGYERAIQYVVPRLGSVKLQELGAGHLNALYAELRTSGGRYQDPTRRLETRPLGPGTVHAVHAVVSKACNDAIDLGLLTVNPVSRAKPPRVHLPAIEAWTADELATFLAYLSPDPLYAIWRLAAFTGLRRGELAGLRWGDVDLASRMIQVRRSRTVAERTIVTTTPKSGHPRVIDLDHGSTLALAHFREYSPAARDEDFVICAADGAPLHPDRLSQLFRKHVRHSGLRRIRLHDLRHTHASLMLRAGIPLKVVSERLGHADPGFTMRVYQHVLPGMQAAAARAFAELIAAKPGDARPI